MKRASEADVYFQTFRTMNLTSELDQSIDPAELVCLALLEADIDLAVWLLQLALSELHSGAAAHARELIEKAVDAHKYVMKRLEQLPAGFERERCALELGGQRLVQAIVTVERELHTP